LQTQPERRRQAEAFRNFGAPVEDLARQGDVHRADGLAGVATDAEGLGAGIGGQTVVGRRHHQADRAGVDVAEDVAAHYLEGRAGVGAGAAANAAQGITVTLVGLQRGAAVIHQDDMQVMAGSRPADKGAVGGDALGGGATRQEAQLQGGVGQGRQHLFDAGQHDLYRRQGDGELGVALVRDQQHAAVFGDQGVGAGEADAGRTELGADGIAGGEYDLLDIVAADGNAGRRTHQFGRLLAVLVNHRQHHMGRAFAGQLHQPFAEVALRPPGCRGPGGSG